jgi:type IV secretory pathway TraG/TraD family ATPase VirD4
MDRINRVLEALWHILEELSDWLGRTVSSMGHNRRKTVLDADFAKSTDLLSKRNGGFCVDGVRSLSIEDSFKGLIVTGKSGGGKSTCVIIPSCLRMMGTSSLVIHDPSGEIAGYVSGAAHAAGCNVIYLDYTKPYLGGYNPLARIRSVSDIKKVASLLVYTSMGRSSSDPFWSTAACTLLQIIMEIVCNQPIEFRSMVNVVRLLDRYNFKPSSVDALAIQGSPALVDAYKTLASYDKKLLTSIIATAAASIDIFRDPEVALATSFDTLDFDLFRKERTIFFINNSVSEMKYFAVLTSLMFTQYLGHIMRSISSPNELPIYLLLDECSSLSLQGILPIAVANVRKHRCGIMQVYQSLHQLGMYGHEDSRAIRDAVYSTLLLPGQSVDVAKEISELGGQFQFEDESGATKQRRLITVDEARSLNEALLVAGNHKLAKVALRPFYSDPQLRRLASIKPYYPEGSLPFDTPPLIPLP